MTNVFFYGLFMDEQFLIDNGCHPKNARVAYVSGYGLRIGERATMVKSSSEVCYGQVISLENDEIEKLYTPPSVADYYPIQLTVNIVDSTEINCSCYVLPEPILVGTNQEYAILLAKSARKLNLPISHIQHIESFLSK